ncbi:MAG: recombinase RecA [Acidobacteriaceae bacterium]
MSSASALRTQIEAVLAPRISSALTPPKRITSQVTLSGICALDQILHGGLPLGAITEVVGAECSGRTSLALSVIARMTHANKVCAWVDVGDALHPASASAAGVDLARLLWVRCAASFANRPSQPSKNGFVLPKKYLVPPPITKGLHGGGFGPHPRAEVRGLADAVSGLLRKRTTAPQPSVRTEREAFAPDSLQKLMLHTNSTLINRTGISSKPWARIEQALRTTDLLLQAGGFSAIVLDMGSIAPEYASRIPLATWFRYRAAAERMQACVLLLTQYACAKSSAALALHLRSCGALPSDSTVFTGIEHRVEVARQRFVEHADGVPLRKPPQRETTANWRGRTTWAGRA